MHNIHRECERDFRLIRRAFSCALSQAAIIVFRSPFFCLLLVFCRVSDVPALGYSSIYGLSGSSLYVFWVRVFFVACYDRLESGRICLALEKQPERS